MLEDICQTVYPAETNLTCFGGAIRNLLILACTECEAQWRGVLKANSYKDGEGMFSTKDYVLLFPAMRLGEYRVKLTLFPDLAAIAPFHEWDSSKASKSIAWYDSYNSVKHDREGQFSKATLTAAINAVCAIWVMIAAQFGQRATEMFTDLQAFFRFEQVPFWPFPEIYEQALIPFMELAGPVKYPFLTTQDDAQRDRFGAEPPANCHG